MTMGTRIIRAPRGFALSCKGWPQEAALLVPARATWEIVRDLENRGLTMYGRMTAGSWIYIGTERATGYVDESTTHLEDAIDKIEGWRRHRVARSIALEANAADALPEMLQRGVIPDVVTDQTSAHDALNGYVPHGMPLAQVAALRERHPEQYIEQYIERSMASMARHVEATFAFRARGAVAFDYGNNLRPQAHLAGVENAFDIPGVVPEYVRPLPCEGKGSLRRTALSGDPDDIRVTDDAVLEMFLNDEPLCRWIRVARERVAFQGLSAPTPAQWPRPTVRPRGYATAAGWASVGGAGFRNRGGPARAGSGKCTEGPAHERAREAGEWE